MKKAVVLFVLSILFFSCAKSKLPSGNISPENLDGIFYIKWDDDIFTVNDILKENNFQILLHDPDNEFIIINGGNGNVISLKFYEDKFFEASVYTSYYNNTKNEYEKQYGMFVNMLTEKYGIPYLASDTSNVWKFMNNSTIHISYFIDISGVMHFVLIFRDDTIYKRKYMGIYDNLYQFYFTGV